MTSTFSMTPQTPEMPPIEQPPMPAPGWIPDAPIEEPAPDLLPDEYPNPNPDENPFPPVVEPGTEI